LLEQTKNRILGEIDTSRKIQAINEARRAELAKLGAIVKREEKAEKKIIAKRLHEQKSSADT
jgi:hypothetical protein